MTPGEVGADRAKAYSPKEYWSGLADGAPAGDSSGFAPVLHPDAPPWFNRLIDTLQFRAIRRALAMGRVQPGARILDVGCGTGRWVRRYAEQGFSPTGVDATRSMLRVARERGTRAPLITGEAYRLPFTDAAFDLVSDITVIQHIPSSLQRPALEETARVLKPSGCLILMELIRGKGAHIFPRSPDDWIHQTTTNGMKLVGWFGQEYLLLDRLFVWAAQATRGGNSSSRILDRAPEGHISEPSPAARRLYWAVRRMTASLSAWTDPVTAGVCPAKFATHGVFVFRK
jgi:SAM-dependent methyltransferase